MYMTLFFVSLLGENGGFRSKLLKAMDSVVVTPQKQSFLDNCQGPLQQIQAAESSAGPISQDTLRSYWDAQLKPDGLSHSIAECASIATESGSELQTQQQEALTSLYAFFMDLHKVIDKWLAKGKTQPSDMEEKKEEIKDDHPFRRRTKDKRRRRRPSCLRH